jgi:hypothetical protein
MLMLFTLEHHFMTHHMDMPVLHTAVAFGESATCYQDDSFHKGRTSSKKVDIWDWQIQFPAYYSSVGKTSKNLYLPTLLQAI